MRGSSLTMRQLIVDRFEGIYVICEDSEKKFFAIDKSEAPVNVKEGDVLCIEDDGTLRIDTEETARRRAAAVRKQRGAFRK